MRGIGRYVLALGAAGLGAIGLVWRDFAGVWQPVPDGIAGRVVLACVAGLVLLLGGAALTTRRYVRFGAVLIGAMFFVFASLWVRRIIGFPQIFATWSGCAEELAVVFAAILLFSGATLDRPIARAAVAGFGVCAICFGIVHFLYPVETAAMVPGWAPGGRLFWAYATGAGHFLGGCAILARFQALLATRLLTAMYASFNLFVWGPTLAAAPHDHVAWAGNALNLTLVGVAWVVADAISRAQSTGMWQPLWRSSRRTAPQPDAAAIPS